MGFKTGDFPAVGPTRLFDLPYLERVKLLSRHWVDYGFGAPKMTHVILRGQARRPLHRGLAADLVAHLGPEPARHRHLVDRADLPPDPGTQLEEELGADDHGACDG